MDADTKLVASFMVGNRGGKTEKIFIDDLKERLAHLVHLTTDDLHAYLDAVEEMISKLEANSNLTESK